MESIIDSKTNNRTIMASVEGFKTAIVRIRDILRGPGCGVTGMDSMRHICLYLMSRYMTLDKTESLGIPKKFAWESFMEMIRTQNGGVQFALDYFYHPEADCLTNHLDRLFDTDQLVFTIKNIQKHKEILEILDKVDIAHVDSQMDLLGWVYEQHLKTGSGAARDLGQFFTDRFICEYMTTLCKPGFKAPGVPESVIDPSMGTGGFLTSYVKYYKKNQIQVDWSVQQKEIHGYDSDPRVAGIACLNLFMELGGVRAENLKTHDSLYGDVDQVGYDIILANMPFGLKNIKHAECCERIKKLKIRGTKSEPLFLQLMITSLNLKGRCAVVVPDGVLLNNSIIHNGTRKYLLDHFELRRVIKMKGKFFMNTGIQPSILFFENTGQPTAEIEFWDIIREDNGSTTEKRIATVQRTKLDQAFSLDVRRYIEEEKPVVHVGDYPRVKIADVCSYSNGKTLSSADKKENGEYPVMGGGIDYVGAYDSYNREGTNITISKSGASSGFVKLHTNQFWAGDCFTVVPHDSKTLNIHYLYYYLRLNLMTTFMEKSTGTSIPHCKWGDICDYTIVLPPLPTQEQIVETLDRIYAPGSADIGETLKLTNRAMDLILLDPTGSHLNQIIRAQTLIRDAIQMRSMLKQQMADIMRSVERGGYERKKLSSVCNISKGKRCLDGLPDGGYPYQDVAKISRMVKEYILDGPAILTPRAMSIGRFVYTEEKCHPSDDMFILKPVEMLLPKYVYYYCILHLSDKIKESIHGVKPTIDYSAFDCLSIFIPPIKEQQRILALIEPVEKQILQLETLQAQTEANAKFILASYFRTPAKKPEEDDSSEEESDSSSEEEESSEEKEE